MPGARPSVKSILRTLGGTPTHAGGFHEGWGRASRRERGPRVGAAVRGRGEHVAAHQGSVELFQHAGWLRALPQHDLMGLRRIPAEPQGVMGWRAGARIGDEEAARARACIGDARIAGFAARGCSPVSFHAPAATVEVIPVLLLLTTSIWHGPVGRVPEIASGVASSASPSLACWSGSARSRQAPKISRTRFLWLL